MEDPAPRPEVEVPVNYVYRLLQEEQYTPCLGSTTSDSLLAMLDHLTDYILEVAGSEANINSQQDIPQDGERQGNNEREPSHAFQKAPFSLFDEMPGPRRNGWRMGDRTQGWEASQTQLGPWSLIAEEAPLVSLNTNKMFKWKLVVLTLNLPFWVRGFHKILGEGGGWKLWLVMGVWMGDLEWV